VNSGTINHEIEAPAFGGSVLEGDTGLDGVFRDGEAKCAVLR